jgi:site-specific DNA-cytosine methylase
MGAMTRPAYYNEIEPFPCAVLRARIADGSLPPGDVDERDVRTVSPADLRGYGQLHFFAGIGGGALACRLAGVPDDFPIVTAGVPCQPASVAGKRRGASDERWLWPQFLELLRDVGGHYALMENPAGLLTLDDGRAFGGILGGLAELGRDAEWSRVSAADVGAPHERERIWLVAYPDDDARERRSRASTERGGRRAGAPECAHRDAGGEARTDHAGSGREGRGEPIGVGLADADRAGRLALAARDGADARVDVEPRHDADGCGVDRGGLEGAAVGVFHANGAGREELDASTLAGGARLARGGPPSPRRDGSAEPRVGGLPHGLPAHMGGDEWVARPDEPQHAWEPPRLVERLTSDERRALAAFGNAWVPQCAVPALQRILAHAGATA